MAKIAEKNANLGRALVSLGLEDQFLANGELSKFPLVERGKIANDIISEKLRTGDWPTVIKMMFGGFGKAEALYEGDIEQLKEEIVKSAKENPRRIDKDVVKALSEKEENDLIFRIATSTPNIEYKLFSEIICDISNSYFTDPEKGKERCRILHTVAGQKALDEKHYSSAFYHFELAEDEQTLKGLFDIILPNSHDEELLEKAALKDPGKKESRLKLAVLSCIKKEEGLDPLSEFIKREEGGLDPLSAFKLYRKHNVKLTKEELKKLNKKVVKKASRFDLETKLKSEKGITLLWAKEHAIDEPRAAYQIFAAQGYEGNELTKTVISGLKLENWHNEERVLDEGEIKPEHLRKSYLKAPFEVKIKIAEHLKDISKLQKLSAEALGNKNLREAYRLWVAGKGDLEGEYIGDIRNKLIEECIKENCGYLCIENSDKPGKIQAYDAVMQAAQNTEKKEDKFWYLKKSYDIARDIGDEARTQRVREQMVSLDSRQSLSKFRSKPDEKGVDYVLDLIASQSGTDKSQLRRIVEIEKYKV